MSNAKQIADTILNQLGGGKFCRMTGAKNLSFDKDGSLRFGLPGRGFAKDGINSVMVKLDPSDTYTVTFFKIRGGMKYSCKTIKEVTDVYAEQLQEVFREATGLETRMPRVIFQ